MIYNVLLLMLCTFFKGLFLNSCTFFKGLFVLFCHFFKGLSVAKIQNFLLKGKENGNYFFFNLKSASNLNGNLNCSKELEHYAS